MAVLPFLTVRNFPDDVLWRRFRTEAVARHTTAAHLLAEALREWLTVHEGESAARDA